MALHSKDLAETLNVGDVFSKVWLATQTYTETITLNDGDTIVKKAWTQASTNGSYITISAVHETLILALKELINELEAQKCPATQTQIVFTWDSNNNKYVIMAIVKRH